MIEKLFESIVTGGPWAAFAAALVFWLGSKVDRLAAAIGKREECDQRGHEILNAKLDLLLDRRER